MDELAALIAKYVGISSESSRLAIGHVFAFLERRDPEVGQELILKVSGAREAVNEAIFASRQGLVGRALGGVGKMLGGHQGDVLELASRLTSMGFSADQLQKLAQAVFKFCELAVGRQKLQTITDTIPGLSRFPLAAWMTACRQVSTGNTFICQLNGANVTIGALTSQ